MTAASTEGFASGFHERSYERFNGAAPALTGFYFGLGVGGRPVDNHLNSVLVLPGGSSTDLTPQADKSPVQVADGRIQLMFRDKDPSSDSDEYFYRAGHVTLPGVRVDRFQMRDLGCVGECRQRVPQPPGPGGPASLGNSVWALAGFHLYFTGERDHHIDEIAVMLEDDGHLMVRLNDRNDDDVFGYLVDLVRIVSNPGIELTTGEATGSARGGQRVTINRPSRTDFVLRGFHVNFHSSDRHLREVGVQRIRRNQLEVFFGDDSGDDLFDWTVRWANVGRPLVIGVNQPV